MVQFPDLLLNLRKDENPIMNKYYPALIISVLISFAVFSQEKDIPEDFCLSNNEYKLFLLIDSLRSENDLLDLQLSVSLSFVAKTHVKDLNDNNPDTSICNMNSWSDKGNWRACCHNKYLPDPKCIVEKPSELTNYRGEGHELAYWEFGDANADSIFKLWTELDPTREFLLNQGKWDSYKWKAIGVGIFNGYASIWLGEVSDKDGTPALCNNNELLIEEPVKPKDGVVVIEDKQNRFYLIFGSYTKLADTQKEAGKFVNKGFPNVKIIKGKSSYRISLNDFPSLMDAKNGKNKLGEKYQSAWILHY